MAAPGRWAAGISGRPPTASKLRRATSTRRCRTISLRARAEAEGGLVSTTTRREFEHDLDTGVTERRRVDTKELARRLQEQKAAPPAPASADAQRIARMLKEQAKAQPATARRRRSSRSKDDDLRSMKPSSVVIIQRT